ncbi:hypothetical protein B0I37DRAFT_398482 [Chaetomium sp. MPI-CAGE-AT-0009]|nr:hypothetical protein B0I37DRAFT_398482 [Chaetomium sp. MPI-CAGE-AT-0009]
MASPAMAWVAALLLLPGLVISTPVISLGEPFSFVFSPSTLSNPPKWLSIDSHARRLFGTPGQDDTVPGRVTGVPLNLVATDDSGSTTLAATLVIPLQNQAPDFGTFSSPSAILATPGKSFSFKLDPNTYYATMADNTPLPAWVSFDSPSLSFIGQTPPAETLVQPPQHFSFRVIATDVVGFAGAAMDFDIVVGSHQLAAGETTIALNATHTVKVDGKPAVPGTVVITATPGIPDWLSFNKQTWHLAGVPPDAAEFSDNLNLTVLIDVTSNELTITPGEPFSFDLRPYLLNPRETEVSLETDSSYPWVRLDSSLTTLFGDAPEGLGDSVVSVKIMAKSKKSKKSAFISFEMAIRARSYVENPLQPVLLAVLLPLLLLLALANPRKPALSTRDISGPLAGTFVTNSTSSHASHSLPDLSTRFGKSFPADDVFRSENKGYFNSRTVFLTRPELSQLVGAARLLPPSNKPVPGSGTSQEGIRLPAIVSGVLSTNSLSSITETSIGDIVDSRGLESVGSESRRTFRDRIEVKVPKFLQTPGLSYTGSPSPTEAASTPRPGSSRTAPEMDAVPLGPDSRASHYLLAPPTRKLSWPWLKGVKGKRHGTKLVSGMQRLSEQPRLLTVDTFTSEVAWQPSPTIPTTQGDDPNGVPRAILGSETLPLPQFPRRASLSRPPTRSWLTRNGNRGHLGLEPLHASDTSTTLPTPIPSLLGLEDGPTSSFPIHRETPTYYLDIYDRVIEHNPFRPSRTWSTVPTADGWADETVESLTLSRSTSQPQQNWTVPQESPAIKSHDTTAPVKLPEIASPVNLPQAREGQGGKEKEEDRRGGAEVSIGTSSRETSPTVQPREDERQERSGLTRKSQSNGVSLRSGGSKSVYAVFL